MNDLGTIDFNGYSSRQIEVKTDMGTFTHILLEYDNVVFEINALDHIESLDEILSTFKLIE